MMMHHHSGREEMSECDRHLRNEGEWIEGIQAHSMRQVLDRNFRLAEIDFTQPLKCHASARFGLSWRADR